MPAIFAAHSDALIPTQARVNAAPGKPDPANAAAVIEAIEIAAKACLAGEAAGHGHRPHPQGGAGRGGLSPIPAIPNFSALSPARRAR